jgi:SAM-dependent methyltransferase
VAKQAVNSVDSPYDVLAWVYNRHWSTFHGRVLPVLQRLLLEQLPARAHVLDLCCGTGQLAAALTQRGYRVTGIDRSPEMLRFARENAPQASFLVADARDFQLQEPVDAAVCTHDSLNHVLSLEELTQAFRRVRACLAAGGRFLFDLNMPGRYPPGWTDSLGVVEDDYACVVRGRYEDTRRLLRFDATVFVRAEGWQRRDVTVEERCYPEAEVRSALEAVGFVEIGAYDWKRDLQSDGEGGRMFFVCRRRG